MEWYAVNARPHQETVAARNLERLGLETLAPRIRQQKVIGRRRQTVTAPLFPGYLFARFSMGSHYRAVKYARGVRQVVSFGAIPATVDDAIIEGIRERLTDGFVTVARPSFAAGQTVTIRRAPFRAWKRCSSGKRAARSGSCSCCGRCRISRAS